MCQNNNIDIDESIEYNKNQIVMRKRLQRFMSHFDGLSDHSAAAAGDADARLSLSLIVARIPGCGGKAGFCLTFLVPLAPVGVVLEGVAVGIGGVPMTGAVVHFP